MGELDKATLAKLAAPFNPNDVAWKPQAVRQNRALAVAYIDARTVAERLDQVVAGEWTFEWEEASNGCVKGKLTIRGTTRCDVGEQGDGPQGKTLKAAVSDALKRSAVLFGVGRYLYRLPAQWVDYDAQHKRLVRTPELPAWAKPGTQQEERLSSSGEESLEKEPAPARPYAPETVKKGILSRASKGDPVIAHEGFRGLVVGYLEAVWVTEMPDVREANRHSVLNFVFGDPSSKKLTTAQGKAILAWLTDQQPDGKPVLNPHGVAEAIAILNFWNETAGQQKLPMPSETGPDEESEANGEVPF